jgi:hypothetical protein
MRHPVVPLADGTRPSGMTVFSLCPVFLQRLADPMF